MYECLVMVCRELHLYVCKQVGARMGTSTKIRWNKAETSRSGNKIIVTNRAASCDEFHICSETEEGHV